MHIQTIRLVNFRNFADAQVEFAPGRNLIAGANAQGKTNLLEAIHVLGVGRSHRERKDQNLVRFGQDYYRLEGGFEHIGVKTTIEAAYGEDRKRIRINGKESRPATLLGLAPVVVSSPEDIDLIKRSPGYRRSFLDLALSQISREYLVALSSYSRALAQRNVFLKRAEEGRASQGEAHAWDEAIITQGEKLVSARIVFLSEIRPVVEETTVKMGGAATRVELVYEPRGYALGAGLDASSGGGPEVGSEAGAGEAVQTGGAGEGGRAGVALRRAVLGGLARALDENRGLEVTRGFTLFGPHVDDFRFLCDGRDIRVFGSEGEQRTSVLALRCAEVELMKAKLGHFPIVLLDDVFAELDEARSSALTSLISGFDQIVLTSSRPGGREGENLRRITVAAGEIRYDG